LRVPPGPSVPDPAAPAAAQNAATAGGAAGPPSQSPIATSPLRPGNAMTNRRRGPVQQYGFNCPYCSSRLEGSSAIAAQEGQCPTCGNQITIPIRDAYGRLIDPKTRQIIKQDPHPVHTYAAAGERAPTIVRTAPNKQAIRCPKCQALSPINSNNCKTCGLPFTMEGTTLEAAGASNGFCVASLVLGIIGLIPCPIFVPPVLAVIFGIIGYNQISRISEAKGKGSAIAGIVLGVIGLLEVLAIYVPRWL
jgi:DNA-directed RNA polymerase subunit RPC12/RpoP